MGRLWLCPYPCAKEDQIPRMKQVTYQIRGMVTETMIPGILIGLIGMVMALTTYPICKKIMNARKKKFAPQIMELSDRIMKG